MIQALCTVTENSLVASNTYVLRFQAPVIAFSCRPGQFINIKVNDAGMPLLRRPFSVYHVEGDTVAIIFNVVGLGTRLLSAKRPGEQLDILGPLGRPFGLDDRFSTALLVGGGLGVAPLPMITDALRGRGRSVVTFLGSRTRDQLVPAHLENVQIATDDGSEGFHGTVVDLLRRYLRDHHLPGPKIFGCGPTRMLKELARLSAEIQIPCEVSLESAMACGIGICQGCPVETMGREKKYALVCTDGPVFSTECLVFD